MQRLHCARQLAFYALPLSQSQNLDESRVVPALKVVHNLNLASSQSASQIQKHHESILMKLIFKEPTRRKFLTYGFVASIWSALKTSRLFADDANQSGLNRKENPDVFQMKSDSQVAREKRLSRKLNSPQFRDGKFRNPLPEQTDTFTALRKFVLASSAFREPEQPLTTERRKRADFEIAPQSNLRVTWLGHASLLIEIDGKRFLTDPVWGERASPFSFAGPKRFFEPPLPLSELPKLNAIILSHNHYDHLCVETIRALVDQNIPFLVPLGVGNQLEELGVPHTRIQEYDWWKPACFPKLFGREVGKKVSRRRWCRSRLLLLAWDLLFAPKAALKTQHQF